jgi:hypothetical protein
MPADPFIYPRLLSPTGHCIEDKTTAELDALDQPRLEESTLTAVMDYWWNLNSAEITMYAESGMVSENSSATFIAMRNGTGGIIGDISNAPTFPPRDRVCAEFGTSVTYNDGICTAAYDLLNASGEGAAFSFSFRQIYYNTTTAKYALVFLFEGASPAHILKSGADYSSTNGGTMVFFGQTVRSGTITPSGYLISVTVSNPTYYTY